jgi:hypothetical protein
MSVPEIRIPNSFTDVLNLPPGKVFPAEVETPHIGAEQDRPARRKQCQAPFEEALVVSFQVKSSDHLFGIGKSRRIQNDQVPAVPFPGRLLEKHCRIGADQGVSPAWPVKSDAAFPGLKTIQFKIGLPPVQIGVGHVYRVCGQGIARRGVY